MKEVTINLKGGLGNYLFQIACAYSYALKHDMKLVLNVEAAHIGHNSIKTYYSNVLSQLKVVSPSTNTFAVYEEPPYEFATYRELPNPQGNNVRLNGYFQSEKYFIDRQTILNLFEYPELVKMSVIQKASELLGIDFTKNDYCSLHVRRGDYVQQQSYHPLQTITYYEEAMSKMPAGTIFLVFSDDIAWCREAFRSVPAVVFVEGFFDFEDMLLMSLCTNSIICNSTFSWWGAWLNRNQNKKVVAPSNWFGPAYSNARVNDLYFSDCIVL